MQNSAIFFMECQNAACGLRFPLDLAQFEGKFCPRCGSPLHKESPRIQSQRYGSSHQVKYRLIGILDNVRSVHNVGSVMRSAEGAGFANLHFCGITPSPDTHPTIAKTALGAENMLSWQYTANAPELLTRLKQDHALILALEATPQAISLYDFHLENKDKMQDIVLIIGNEPAGVDPKLIALSDACLYIPMLGQKSSLNVAIAFSIVAYHLRFML